jgi:hypothetical protein
MKTSKGRVALAAVLAPPVAIVALSLVMMLTGDFEKSMSFGGRLIAASDSVFFLLFFGTPIAYALEGAIGVPAYRWLVRKNRLRLLWVVATAGLGGAVSFAIGFSIFFGSVRIADIADLAFGGACAGLVAGGTFWVVAFAEWTGINREAAQPQREFDRNPLHDN